MSRELKFRAWGVTNKVMYDRVLAGPGNPCSCVWDEDRKDWVNFDDACGTIIQYTGLMDKNGVEIYEGDICRDGNTIYEVRWVEDCAKFGVKVVKSDYVLTRGHTFPLQQYVKFSTLQCFFEIIGNIYEHSHLLT